MTEIQRKTNEALRAFVAGHKHGSRYGKKTAREIHRLHPNYSIDEHDAFTCGCIDGVNGQHQRLTLICETLTARGEK